MKLKRNYSNVITVDVGDHIQGGVLGAVSQGSAIIDIMNEVGFDVVTLGNHEFDYGVDQLVKLKENISSNYISSNFCYRKNKTTVFDPYKIIEKGGKKIAFIGVLTPLTFTKTFLWTLKDENGDRIYDFLIGNNTQELYDRVQNDINNAKKEADYVILLTHLGMDIEQYQSNELLSKLENIDAVLDAHTHLIYNTSRPDKNQKNITIAQTGTKLQSIGKLTIKPNGTITSEILEEIPEPSNKTDAIQLTRGKKTVWVSKKMNDFLNNKNKQYEDELNIQYGYTDYDLTIRPEGSTDSSFIYCRYKECTVGNLAADAFKYVGNSDIAIVNAGAIKANLKKGNLTRAQIMEAVPYFTNVVVKQISGKDILDALEQGTRNCPDSSGAFPQVSGLSYNLNLGINSSVLTDELGFFLNVTGPRRVSNVTVNGEPLDLNKIYNVSMREFISTGGDGYSMFSDYEVYNETLMTDTDSLSYYIKYVLNGEIPSFYNDSLGRINIYNSSEVVDNTIVDSTIVDSTNSPETDTIIPSSTVQQNSSTEFNRFNVRKSSGGLSTGGIIGIIIPSVVIAIAVVIATMMCSKSVRAPTESNLMIAENSRI